MKKLSFLNCIITILVFWSSQVFAQISINTLVMPPYQSRIAEYASNPNLMLISITNTSTTVQEIQLTAIITGDNGISAWVKKGYRSPSAIRVGVGETITMNGNDIAFLFDINKIEYTGISRGDMTRGLGLLEGNYSLCIRALNYRTLEPVSLEQTGCATFRISDLEPPRILAPFNAQKVGTKGAQLVPIVWSTPAGSSPLTQYRVKIVEMITPRNPNDAIQSTRPLVEETIQGNTLVYGPQYPSLIPGRQYAMEVQAIDPTLKSKFRNNGKSEVSTFIYNQDNTPLDPFLFQEPKKLLMAQLPAPVCGCRNETADKMTSNVSTNDVVMIGDGSFEMRINSISGNSSNGYNGTGTVALPAIGGVPGLKLRVNFANLKVNSTKRMFVGIVRGAVKNNAPSFMPKTDKPDLSGLSLESNEIENIDDYLKNNKNQVISQVNQAANALGFELPLGIVQGPITIGINEVFFNESQSWFNASTAMDLPDAGPKQKLALSGRDFCMTANSFCKEGIMSLAEDFPIPMLSLTLLAAQGESEGTHIRFDENGFKSLGIQADYKFPANTLVLASNQAEPLKASLSATTTEGWSNWVASVKVEPFMMSGIADFKFSLAPEKFIIYDHSVKRNAIQGTEGYTMPTSLSFGANQQLIFNEQWKGFFIPEIHVELPKAIKTKENVSPSFIAKNFVFDTQRGEFSGTAGVANILTLDEGVLDGWYFSIDEININIFKNSFTNGQMLGKLMLPISGEKSAENQRKEIDYSCTLSKAQGSNLAFQFNVTVQKDLDFSAFWAKGAIREGSNILIKAGGGEDFLAEATLHGSMSIVADIGDLPDISLGYIGFSNMKISSRGQVFSPGQYSAGIGSPDQNATLLTQDQQDYLLAYHKGPNLYGTSSNTEWLASENKQESLMGFNFTIRNWKPYISNGNIGLTFDTHMELVNGVSFIPKADLVFSVFARPQDGIRKFWKGVGGKIEAVKLEAEANLAGMKISGSIAYFDMNVSGSIKDRGFAGMLTVELPVAKMQMKGLFGARKENNKQSFQFFYLDGVFDITAGITMFPGTSLYGFAGGAYYNMQREVQSEEHSLVKKQENQESLALNTMESFSGVKYTPISGNINSSVGFMAAVYFGLTSRNVLEVEAKLEIGFANGSLNMIEFAGRAAGLNDGSFPFSKKYNSAMIQGNMHALVQLEDGNFKYFDAGIGIKLEYPKPVSLVSAQGNLVFHVEKDKGWYLKLGSPENIPSPGPISLSVGIPGIKLDAKSYFQVGTMEIDDIPPTPQWIRDIINGAKSSSEEESKMVNTMAIQTTSEKRGEVSTEGMIAGMSVGFRADPQFLCFYAHLRAGLGADLSLKYYANGACANNPVAGWYAEGQAFVGAEASCGIKINIFGIKKDIVFVSGGLAAEVKAGLPAPFYAKGRIGGTFSVLNGLISKNFRIGLEVGTVCESGNGNPEELALIADVFPKNGETVGVLDKSAVSFNYSLTNDFVVPLEYIDEDGMPYTVYQLFRFKKDLVKISVVGTENTLNTSDFVLAGRASNNLFDNRRGGRDIYSIEERPDAPMLKPNSDYTLNVTANVLSYRYTSFTDAMNTSKEALEALKNNTSSFELVATNGKVYEDKREVKFKTDKGPKRILVDNVVESMPYHRSDALPYRALHNIAGNKGYILLRRAQLGLPTYFDCPLPDNQAQTKIRFVLLESGGGVQTFEQDVRVVDNGTRWEFDMPILMPNTLYAAKIYFKNVANSAGSTDGGKTKLNVVKTLNFSNGQTALISNRDLVTNSLRLNGGDHELFAWYFKTGAIESYQSKYNQLRLEKATIRGEQIKRGEKQVNLAKLNWDVNESTKTLSNEMVVKYYYSSKELFNILDVGRYETFISGAKFSNAFVTNRNESLPTISNNSFKANEAVSWVSLLNRAGFDVQSNNISLAEEERMWKDFEKDAFGLEKSLNIEYVNWGGIDNGMYGIAPIRVYPKATFLKTSSLLSANMYGINFDDNQYSTASAEGTNKSSTNATTSDNTSVSNSQRILNRLVGNASTSAHIGNVSQALFSSPSLEIEYAMSGGQSYGKGVIETGNNLLQKLINFKKDQGYPVDIFMQLNSIGKALDQVNSKMQSSSIMAQPPSGLAGPNVIAQPKALGKFR
ncbi:hypothetical protein [Sphingobacterium bovistauri]|uniref:TANFOR domain-containing protein n=1 Tax=Sphingobacterium bovistauri TaxID=2781959 RepID=A0ABS7Z2Y4_9SPHI|nr:hypothetical protein [Sphingobacterium bovistauri]MCA5004536.1 hypothetical protein [Sphingobacterium bovistauri]